MTHDWELVEKIAAELCHMSGRTWGKYTHKHHWRRLAVKLIELAEGCK